MTRARLEFLASKFRCSLGGYDNLYSYQRSKVVFKGTAYFIDKWVPRISRLPD